MSMTLATSHQRTHKISSFLQPQRNPWNPISFASILKSGFTSGLKSGGAVLERKAVLGRKIMSELVEVSAFSGNNREESVGLFQEEGISDGSMEFSLRSYSEGLESTINRLSKWLVAALFGGIMIWRHDGDALWAAIGAILNGTLSVKLKRILRQERPVSTMRADPGMPSSHAQSIFFILVFVVLSTFELLGLNKLSLTISALALLSASYLTWLRVSQKLHTTSQVLVGAALGSLCSIFWFWLWNAVVMNAFVSSSWVQVSLAFGAAVLCSGFLVYVIRNWLKNER